MAERQVSQRGTPRNTEYEVSEGEVEDDSQDMRQSGRSPGQSGFQSQPRLSNDGSADTEVKDLFQIMVKQQAVQSIKLDFLKSQIDSASSKVDQVALKMHGEEKKVFRKKGIEYQYHHNAHVVNNYDEIAMAVAARKYDCLPH